MRIAVDEAKDSNHNQGQKGNKAKLKNNKNAQSNYAEQNTVLDRKSTRLNSSHSQQSRMPSSA